MKQSNKPQVWRAATLLVGISIGGKLLGFVREQVIAGMFGATRLTDAYILALTVPQMIVGLIGGPVSTATLPVFSRYLAEDDPTHGWELVGTVARVVFVVLLILIIAITILASPLIRLLAPWFSSHERAATAAMLRVMAPIAMFLTTTAFFSAILNALKQFGLPALGPLLMNAGTIAVGILLSRNSGITSLAWATLSGAALSAFFLGWQLRRQRMSWCQLSSLTHPGLGQVMKLAVPMMIGTLFDQFRIVAEKSLASGLDVGSIAALNYASKLVQLPVGVFVTALATVIYPKLADHAGRNDYDGLHRSVGSGLKLLSIIMVPATVGLIVLRTPIISLAFERGHFDGTATAMTATALVFYAIGLFGVANQQILVRAFYVLGDSSTPVGVGIGTSLLNIALAFWLVKPLHHGGLALANSITMLVNMVMLMMLLERRLGSLLGVAKSLVKIVLAAVAMGCVVLLTFPMVEHLGRIIALAGSVLMGSVAYFSLIYLFRVEEMDLLTYMVKRRLGLRSRSL